MLCQGASSACRSKTRLKCWNDIHLNYLLHVKTIIPPEACYHVKAPMEDILEEMILRQTVEKISRCIFHRFGLNHPHACVSANCLSSSQTWHCSYEEFWKRMLPSICLFVQIILLLLCLEIKKHQYMIFNRAINICPCYTPLKTYCLTVRFRNDSMLFGGAKTECIRC